MGAIKCWDWRYRVGFDPTLSRDIASAIIELGHFAKAEAASMADL